jgi:hypothetical protein
MPTSSPSRVLCIALTAFAVALALSSRDAAAQTAPAPTSEPQASEPQASGDPARANEPSSSGGSEAAKAPHREAVLARAGASLFALAYLASALSAATGYESTSGTDTSRAALWIPAAGPFIMMGNVKAAGQDALLVLDGLSQVVGLTLLVYGLDAKPLAVSVAPSTAHGAPGAAFFATF